MRSVFSGEEESYTGRGNSAVWNGCNVSIDSALSVFQSHLKNRSPILSGESIGAQILLGFAMVNLGCGLLRLVPIPPLEMGVLLWSRLPHGPGSRRVAYHLLEEAWGVAVLIVLLLVPLAGQQPLLLAVLSAVADPLLHLL